MKVYVASSWRNNRQPGVVKALRDMGHEVYDFRNPPSGPVEFRWVDVNCKVARSGEDWSCEQQIKGLNHKAAKAAFEEDYKAMEWAHACVMVLPCGRSASLEAGWFAGSGKPLYALIDYAEEPELMLSLATKHEQGYGGIFGDIPDLLRQMAKDNRAMLDFGLIDE